MSRFGRIASAAAILLSFSANAAEITSGVLTFGDHQRTYSIYVPDKARDAAAPVLVLLHGTGQTGLLMAQLWQPSADQEGIVLVAPDALTADHWSLRADSTAYIGAVVSAATAGLGVDPRRIYLFGQSAGAVYSLTLAMLESKYFAAMAIHAGAWRYPSEFELVKVATRKIPLMIIVGDRDEFFPLLDVHHTEHALEKAGFPIVVDVVSGQHHWFDVHTAPAIDATAWDFLKSRKLDQDPVFITYDR
jgi:poly(3-hydroxybutyrate) depolymerase